MARIPYASADELFDEPTLDLVAENDLHVRNSTLIIGNNPALLSSFRKFGNSLRDDIHLSKRVQELLLLAVGGKLESSYMLYNHVEEGISNAIGVTDDEIEAILDEDLVRFNQRETAVIHYARSMAANDVGDLEYDAVAEFYDDESILDITITVGYFILVATSYNALQVDPENVCDPLDKD